MPKKRITAIAFLILIPVFFIFQAFPGRSEAACLSGPCLADGSACNANSDCASNYCQNSICRPCGTSRAIPAGGQCNCGSECQSGLCGNGVCLSSCTDECSANGAKRCSGNAYQTCSNSDGDSCLEWSNPVPCPEAQTCYGGVCRNSCSPSCLGRDCGDDGCGGSCGTCPAGNYCNASNRCVTNCIPYTCTSLGYPCGLISDGCGGTLTNCTTCPAGSSCQNNRCASGCMPACADKMCGDDGCGGSCGACNNDFICNESGLCVFSCTPKVAKKCDGKNLYWYDSCGRKGELAQNCGNDVLLNDYRCNANWRQQAMISNGCAGNACTEQKSWTNAQNCSLTGKICKNGACVSNDLIPPAMFNLAPSKTVYSPNAVLTVTTKEAASCRYHQTDVKFDQMTGLFSSSNKLYHSAPVSLKNYGSFIYYVRCRDAAGNASSASAKISFRYLTAADPGSDPEGQKKDAEAPVISNLFPSGEISSASTTISCATDEKAVCKYDTADVDYEAMANQMENINGGREHKKEVSLSADGDYEYYLKCRDEKGNSNKEAAKISFNLLTAQKPGPAVSGVRPFGKIYQKEVALEVTTEKTAICRYSENDEDFQSMKGIFETVDGQQQMAAVTLPGYGEYRYYVRCQDDQGNVQGSQALISFEYKNPQEEAEPVSLEKEPCAAYSLGEENNECETAENCVCDPDCPASGENADPDCATGEEGADKKGGNFVILAVFAGLTALIAAISIIFWIKKRNGSQEDDYD